MEPATAHPVKSACLQGYIIAVMLCGDLTARPAHGEVYVAAQAGAAFPADFRNVVGTGSIHGVQFSRLDLADTGLYGAKVGYFFEDKGWTWVGIQVEVVASTPHLRRQEVATGGADATAVALTTGAHVRILATALNVVARYRAGRIEPYAGAGLAFVGARVSGANLSVSDASPGMNLLVGLKGYLTPQLAVFVEGKYVYASFQFEDTGLVGAGIKGVYSAPSVVGGIAWHFR